MTSATRIAWLIQGDEQWGIRTGSRSLIMALGELGVDCPVLALGGGEFAEECKTLGVDVVELGVGTIPMFSGSVLRKATQFVRLVHMERQARHKVSEALASLGADAIHFRRPNMIGIGGPAARANRIPAFWHIPNAIGNRYPFDFNRRLYQSRCRRYGIVPIANSRYTAGTLGYEPVRPEVMYLSADVDRFDPDKLEAIPRESLGIGPDSIVFGVVAKLHPRKGQDRAIKAALRLAGEGHDVHLVIVGGPTRGAFFEHCKALCDASPESGRVHFVGPVGDTERYYGLMDFSLNSRVDPEPCGISVLESMMAATPALVHASGGPAETVLDGQTGWHYHGPEADDIRSGLLRAIGDRDRWPEIGKAAREHAIREFSTAAQARHYMDIVQREQARRAAGQAPAR